MMRLLVLLALLCSPATAQETVTIGYGSGPTTVTLTPTIEEGAVARLDYDNRAVNNPSHEGEYTLSMDGITVTFTFSHDDGGRSEDAIEVEVGPDYIAVPRMLSLPENRAGVILIYPLEGVGM